MGPISTSIITINSFFHILIVRVTSRFRPRSTSSIINTSITPIVTIITTYISPPVTIIATDITLLGAMTTISYSLILTKIFVNSKEINWQTQQYTTSIWVMEGSVDGTIPIYTSPVNINYVSTIAILIVAGILRPSSTFTTNTRMINSTIARERADGILRHRSTYTIVTTIINSVIARGRVAGLKIPISTYSIT